MYTWSRISERNGGERGEQGGKVVVVPLGGILTRVEAAAIFHLAVFSTFYSLFSSCERELALPRSLVTINHARDTLTKKYYTRVNNVNLC